MADIQEELEGLNVDAASENAITEITPAVEDAKSEEKAAEKAREAEIAQAAERREKMDPKHIALFEAIAGGNFQTVKKYILEDGISANIKDEHDMTPLLQASYKGSAEMCEFLLSQGSEINTTCHTNYYTPLMMAAVSGKKEIVKLLLHAGANVNTVNSIGKTAADLAGFVGQHEIATLIRNYLTMDRLRPYYTPQGTNSARIEEEVAQALQEIVMATSYHPVKIVISVNENPKLCTVECLKTCTAVLDDLCRKCMRAKDDFDEVLALKLHYVSAILQLSREHLMKNKTDLSALLKTLLKENEKGVKVGCERIIRKSLTMFPYHELPLLQYLVQTIGPTELGGDPTALQCVQTIFNGMQAMRDVDTWCSACGQRNTEMRCSACKKARYCSQRCQKLHWFAHKKACKQKAQDAN